MIDAWEFALLALAAWRTWYLLAWDSLLDRPREAASAAVREFIQCPYCLGFWVALAWTLTWSQWPEVAQWTALPLALSAVVILIDATVDKLRGE